MGLMRPLAPYAVVSLIVVAASGAMLGLSLSAPDPGRGPSPSPIATAAPVRDLGEIASQLGTPRIAYWREEAGLRKLWVTDLGGTRRWPIASMPVAAKARAAAWSPDGTAVAYVQDERALMIAFVDGSRISLAPTAQAGQGDWRILDLRWKPDGKRIATTLITTEARTQKTDVFVVDIHEPVGWTRITALDDAYAAGWLDEDELLIETVGGLIARVREDGLDARVRGDGLDADPLLKDHPVVRPITGMSAVSPRVGGDGRLYFIGGGYVGGPVDVSRGPVAFGSVWSVTLDGNDLRRETTAQHERVRLDGRWPDGRFVVSTSGGAYLLGKEIGLLPWSVGNIRTAVPFGDGSAAIAFTTTRIVRIDTKAMARSPTAPEATRVLLDGVEGADVWVGRPPAHRAVPAAPPFAATGGQAARFTFVLGGHLWATSADGFTRLATGGVSGLRWISEPQWSPRGDRLLAFETSRERGYSVAALVFERDGRMSRWDDLGGTWSRPQWSPDGSAFAYSVPRPGAAANEIPEMEVRFISLDGARIDPIFGQQPAWTSAGLYLIDNGRRGSVGNWRVDHSVQVVMSSAPRAITSAQRIAADPRARQLVEGATALALSSLTAARDGTYLTVQLNVVGPSGGYAKSAFAVVRTADGAVIELVPFDPRAGSLQEIKWSPIAPVFGATSWSPSQQIGGPSVSRAVVHDARTGALVVEHEGRFGGWSPDGSAFYVAKPDGLYAFGLDGSPGIRISPIGVPVAATRP